MTQGNGKNKSLKSTLKEKKKIKRICQLFAITPTSNQDIKILYNMFQPTTGFSLGSKSENINGEERKTNIR
jgi:hypothetical protein